MTLSESRVFAGGPGWYRGDFHAHTTCSDGAFSPRALSDLAAEQGLDFLAITDHNTIKAFDDFDDSYGRMILPGVEITLDQGHCNVLGFEGNVAWVRELLHPLTELSYAEAHSFYNEGKSFRELLDQVTASGLFVCLLHPLEKPYEWRDGQTPVSFFQGIEVINDPTFKDAGTANAATRRLWSAWLNAGYRVTGIGGTDFHSLKPEDDPNRLMRLDLPLTYVYAAELSCQAVMKALRLGHAYVTMGPKIKFEARSDGRSRVMGDDLGVLHSPANLYGWVEGCTARAHASLIRNGKLISQAPVKDGEARVEWEVAPESGGSSWYRFEVVDDDDQSIAISNPIFFGATGQPQPRTYGSFPEASPVT